MIVSYRKLFLKDLANYKSSTIFLKVKKIVFEDIPKLEKFNEIFQIYDIIQLKGTKNRYRIKIGEFRIGLELNDNSIEFLRFLHRREFYRYF